MNLWKWDPFVDVLQQLHIKLERSELLAEGAGEISLARTKSHDIALTVKSPSAPPAVKKKIPPGMLYENEEFLNISSPVGTGKICGVFLSDVTTNLASQEANATTSTYEARSIRFSYKTERTPTHTIDHIANIPEHYIWPSITEEKSTNENYRFFPDGESLTFRETSSSERFSRSSLIIKVGDFGVVLGYTDQDGIAADRPGYILYSGSPDEEDRRKIRACLSFALGVPLIYFGHTRFCADGKVTEIAAVSPHTFNGLAWGIASAPPAPITEGPLVGKMLSANLIERLVNSLYSNMDNYALDGLIWRLWYSEAAPYFMRPAYYGAMIEGLQKKLLEGKTNKIQHTIIEKGKYKKVRGVLERYVGKLEIEEDAKSLFIQKLQNGNSAPQRILASRLYSKLHLSMGNLELSAWNKRNDAAHGNEIPKDEMMEFIRDTKILRIMLFRIILRITNGGDKYIDYFTYHHPVRNVGDAIPSQDSPLKN